MIGLKSLERVVVKNLRQGGVVTTLIVHQLPGLLLCGFLVAHHCLVEDQIDARLAPRFYLAVEVAGCLQA